METNRTPAAQNHSVEINTPFMTYPTKEREHHRKESTYQWVAIAPETTIAAVHSSPIPVMLIQQHARSLRKRGRTPDASMLDRTLRMRYQCSGKATKPSKRGHT